MENGSDNGHGGGYPEPNDEGDNWSSVLTDKRYVCFEDPFSGTPVPKKEFHSMYGPACREIFQCSITVGVLFAANPVIMGEWRFVDEDARLDLSDAAVELNLVPSFDEICAGETEQQRAARQQKEREERANSADFRRALEESRKLYREELERKKGSSTRGGPGLGWVRGTESPEEGAKRVAAEKRPKTKADLESELVQVLAAFESSALSNKQRKKLERRHRGILAALEKSDEGVEA